MSRLRVHSVSISLDGYGAGANQDPENPLGRGGLALHEWRKLPRPNTIEIQCLTADLSQPRGPERLWVRAASSRGVNRHSH
jgi:hypothetical protein